MKMFNIGESFSLPPPSSFNNVTIWRYAETFARLNIEQGSGGRPLKTLEYFKVFFENCLSQSQKITSDFKHVSVTLKLLDRITPDFP